MPIVTALRAGSQHKPKGPLWVRLLVCAVLVAGMGVLRLEVFPRAFVPLTYALPLLVWLGFRDVRMLWTMAGLFVLMGFYKWLYLVDRTLYGPNELPLFVMMQMANILLTAWVVHRVVRLSTRLERVIATLEATNTELEASNEELAAREEEITQQNEELQSQASEMEQQTEELSAQTEELQGLNEQIAARERSLSDLLDVTEEIGSEETLSEKLGGVIERLLGARVAGAAIVEPAGSVLQVRPLFGVAPAERGLRRERTLAEMVMTRDRAGFVADTGLRPDLDVPELEGGERPGSVLAASLRVGGSKGGALEVYSAAPGEWSEAEVRLVQWFAEQCGRTWTMSRLRNELGAQRRILRTVTDNAKVAQLLLDERGCCTYANPAAMALTGSTREELGAEPLHALIEGECRAEVESALAEGRGVNVPECQLRRRGGAAALVSLSLTVIEAPGQARVFVAEITDVSEALERQAEREALLERERAAREEAERAGRAKDEFVATLSHELRTPLNAIMGWAGLLRKSMDDPGEVCKGLEVIERNARQQGQLISDLLDISRITAGKVRLEVQTVDLPQVIQAAAEAVRPAAEAKGVRITRVVDPVDRVVTGDPSRLQQVVWNLLINAVKFTPRGGQVQVSVARVASYVQIAVSDTGSGIEKELLPHVFERYRQGDSTSTRRAGGLGLGLSIVKHLVDLHGGTITVHSEGPGRGATFRVLLPVRAVEDSEAGPAAPEAAAPAAMPSFRGASVLVVDDEEDARELVRRILADRGAEVRTAGSAEEALRLIAEAAPSVLVSDIGMPGTDGYGFIRRLREERPGSARDLPAIALTAFARSEDRTRALLAGFQSHIAKPVEAAELVATVASMLTRLSPPGQSAQRAGSS